MTEGFAATQVSIDSMRVEARDARVEAIERLVNIEAGISNLSHLTDALCLPQTGIQSSQPLETSCN